MARISNCPAFDLQVQSSDKRTMTTGLNNQRPANPRGLLKPIVGVSALDYVDAGDRRREFRVLRKT